MYKKKERALKEEMTTLPNRRRTQSFSSSLLDSIYRSIDHEPDMSKKQSSSVPPSRGRTQFLGEEDTNNNNKELTSLRRATMVETRMERQKSQRTTNTTKGTPRTGNVVSFQQPQQNIKMEKDHRQGLDFTRTKLRASEIYGESKKVKQPISPGGRIASFLYSIFIPTKKAKICSINDSTKPKSSSCSTSSFSRTCLSKTPTTTPGRRSKRSIRFYPVSYLNYDGEDEDDDDDDVSCSSSDLFELDHHLIGIGNGRYYEELPVYETTSFKTNQVIADGFFV